MTMTMMTMEHENLSAATLESCPKTVVVYLQESNGAAQF